MRPIEPQARNAIIPLNPSRLLQPTRKVLADFAEDGNLALDDLLFADVLHMTRHVLDETLASIFIHDLLVQCTGSVEVLGMDL